MGVLAEGHPDVWVPRLLAKRLGISFLVENSADDLPGWFSSAMSANVTGARMLPKTRSIYGKFMVGEKRVNVGGDASEICRSFFDKYCKLDPKAVCTADFAQMLSYCTVSNASLHLAILRRIWSAEAVHLNMCGF
jgi:hypothetical protein